MNRGQYLLINAILSLLVRYGSYPLRGKHCQWLFLASIEVLLLLCHPPLRIKPLWKWGNYSWSSEMTEKRKSNLNFVIIKDIKIAFLFLTNFTNEVYQNSLLFVQNHANWYKRYIVPVLSVQVDFYIRVFVRILHIGFSFIYLNFNYWLHWFLM